MNWTWHRRSLAAMARAWVLVLGGAVMALLAGCGTTHATFNNQAGEPVMLLGYDPVAYFKLNQPTRGLSTIKVNLPERTYYFANTEHKALFKANPKAYEPQYAGFCASGAAFAIKLGSDPTSWQIWQGRLFIFGDVLGHEAWKIDPAWNVQHADALWPELGPRGWRHASLRAYAFKVSHYKNTQQIKDEWALKNAGRSWPNYDPGGMFTNLFFKSPGWRAAEGFGQPALGYPQ
jgi:YHS domain-containing protein